MSVFSNPLRRRSFLMTLAGGAGAYSLFAAKDAPRSGKVRVVDFDANGNKTGVTEVDKVVKSDADWKKQLGSAESMAFEVTRKEGTERAGTGQVRLQPRRWALPLHLLQHHAVRFEDEVRIRHRLAQLLSAHRERKRGRDRRTAVLEKCARK